MATVFKEEAKTAKTIRELEEYMRERGIFITYRADGLLISVNEDDCVLLESETGRILPDFPSSFEGTRVQLVENYIKGT